MPMRMRDEQKDKALHVSCEGWTGVAFGVALFADVCTDVAALAIQKEGGKAALRLFDPYAPAEDVFAGGRSKDARIALYSNHYQHGFEPTEDDLHNLASLPEGALRIAALLLVFAPCAHARRRPSPARVSGGAMIPFAGHGQ